MGKEQPRLNLETLLADPNRRRTVDPSNPHNVLQRVRTLIGRLSPDELKDGARKLLRTMVQDDNPDIREAREIRTTAGTLLDPMVAWGISKGIDPPVYKDELVTALIEQNNKLVFIFSREKDEEEGNEQRIYDDIRALVRATDTITAHLSECDRARVRAELRRLGEHIQDRELRKAIAERLGETLVRRQKGQVNKATAIKEMEKKKKIERADLAEFRAEVLRLDTEGKSADEIANRTHRRKKSVYHALRWLKAHDERKESNVDRQRREAEEWRKIARAYFREGKLSNAQIAKALPERLRRNPSTIANYRNKWEKEEHLPRRS